MSDQSLPRPIRNAVAAEQTEIGAGAATLLDLHEYCLSDAVNVMVDKVFPDRDVALGSIAYDGVSPLPAALLDMGCFPVTLTRLTYDPVRGMHVAEPLELDGKVDDDILREYLGHAEV